MNLSFCFSSVTLDPESKGYNTGSQKMLLVLRQPFSSEHAVNETCALMEAPRAESKIMQVLGKRTLTGSASA